MVTTSTPRVRVMATVASLMRVPVLMPALKPMPRLGLVPGRGVMG